MSLNLTQAKKERIERVVRLAEEIQTKANRFATDREKEIARLVEDPRGKALAVALTDQSFRSSSLQREGDQMRYLLQKYAIPSFLSSLEKGAIALLQRLPPILAWLAKKVIAEKTAAVIIPEKKMQTHVKARRAEGVGINLNRLGEAILGEEEAAHRLSTYLEDLKNPDIEALSVKVSTLFSQINLLDWEHTLAQLSERYKRLVLGPKFVTLDMEEYKDLRLTISLFKKVLSECPEVSAGIVLQSYLPDSFAYLEELTEFALKRGGAPIKVRIVKGANLAMERVEASIKGWPLAPYDNKIDVDTNFKKMLEYALQKEHVKAVKIGVGSHNLFDIAYARVLAEERGVLDAVTFEMLEGMGEPIRRVMQERGEDLLLYCPVAEEGHFQNAVAYLIRRLDENTAKDNFLRVSFQLQPGSPEWENQRQQFVDSVMRTETLDVQPKRGHLIASQNAPDTDWSLEKSVAWGQKIVHEWEAKIIEPIPLVIGGKEILYEPEGKGDDPSRPGKLSYRYQMANKEEVNRCIASAARAGSGYSIAEKLQEGRGRLIGAMVRDVGKIVQEADAEVSEAIDFAEYYKRSKEEWDRQARFKPKGIVFVASPWNFPASIPAGGIIAALMAGNAVIFKPAPEAVLVGYTLSKLLWEAGVPKDVLQFVPCSDAMASHFVADERVNTVVLTGATATAEHLFGLRPGLDLIAETGGKNSMIVTALADRDLAVRDIVQSAFGFAGQKCSACSVLILEEEVFDDPIFKKQLKDAVSSLSVGSAYNTGTKVNPLIRAPEGSLAKSLQEKNWLVTPKIDPGNPQLISPGVLWDVKLGSFLQQTELFGPVLSVMRAKNLEEAVALANATPYGLTAGLHSLDEREHVYWLKHIQAGNCYINRGITGAIVGRQPFGGTKKSSFGPGLKAGGPNYLLQMMHVEQSEGPENYASSWNDYFSKDSDPMKILGQSNIQRYVPYERMVLRVHPQDQKSDVERVIKAAALCGTSLRMSEAGWESDQDFLAGITEERVRLLSMPSPAVVEGLSRRGLWQLPKPACLNGRIELLNYLREISISYDYHRYGNLGTSA